MQRYHFWGDSITAEDDGEFVLYDDCMDFVKDTLKMEIENRDREIERLKRDIAEANDMIEVHEELINRYIEKNRKLESQLCKTPLGDPDE